MPKLLISDKTLHQIRGDGERNVFYYDTKLTGFGARVTKAGVRAFFYQYTSPRTNAQRRMTIGKVDKVSPKRTREIATELADQVRDGIDPLDEKNDRREAWTCAELIVRYVAEQTQMVEDGRRSIHHIKGIASRIKLYVRPGLGMRKVCDVDLELIKKILTKAAQQGATNIIGDVLGGAMGLNKIDEAAE